MRLMIAIRDLYINETYGSEKHLHLNEGIYRNDSNFAK